MRMSSGSQASVSRYLCRFDAGRFCDAQLECRPQPPAIIGPWYLWKLLVDAAHQRSGDGRDTVGLIDLVRREGASELLTSYLEGPGDPGPIYARLGFEPTGERDENDEVILTLQL